MVALLRIDDECMEGTVMKIESCLSTIIKCDTCMVKPASESYHECSIIKMNKLTKIGKKKVFPKQSISRPL